MNDYELFQAFLDDKEVVYKAKDINNADKLFRIPQKLEGGGVVDIVVVFDDDYIKIVVMGIASVSDTEKLPLIYELFNEFNHAYKYFKFYLDSDGDVVLEGDFVTDLRDGDFDPEMLFAYMGVAWKCTKASYPKIMKVIWS